MYFFKTKYELGCERVKTLTFQKRLYYNFEVQCRNSLRKWVKL